MQNELHSFTSKFLTSPEPMTKLRARNLIDTRVERVINHRTRLTHNPNGYTKAECAIFRAIVDGIETGQDWQHFDIHGTGALCSTKPDRLAQKTRFVIRTVYRALKRLSDDGLIQIHKGTGNQGQDQYSVNLMPLHALQLRRPVKLDRRAYQHQQYLKRKAAKADTITLGAR